MPAASITINGVTGSDIDLPINILINLNNNNVGDESSYAWSIEDKPSGSAASLTGATTTNPTFTPDVEGTYLVKLVVDAGLPTEATDTVVAAVLQLKSGYRIPAATETTEANATRGWAETTNVLLREHDDVEFTQLVYAGVAAGPLTLGTLVYPSSTATLKSGLPGEEIIPQVAQALATDVTVAEERPIGYLVRRADHGVAPIVASDVVICLRRGLVDGLTGSPSVGDPVYLSDTGTLALTPGTHNRNVGYVLAAGGGQYTCDFTGYSLPPGSSAPVDAPFLTDGADATLTQERNIQDLTVALQFTTADATITPVAVENSDVTPSATVFSVLTTGVQRFGIDANGDTNIDGDCHVEGRSNTFDAGAGIGQSWLKTDTGDLTMGTADVANFIFHAGGVDSWQVNGTTYELDSVGGPRKITGVATPVSGTDAVNKDYVDAGYAPSVLYWGQERGVSTSGTTWYMTPGYGSGAGSSTPLAIIVPYDGRISRLYITAGNPPNDDVVFTVAVNGVASTLTATVASGTTDANDTVNTANVSAGEILTVEALNGGALSSAISDGVYVSFQLLKT
jgi:hypothetical protein